MTYNILQFAVMLHMAGMLCLTGAFGLSVVAIYNRGER